MKEYFLNNLENHYKHGLFGGTLTAFYAAIDTGHLLNVIICAAAGTIVSFFLSMLLKKIFKTK